MEELIHYARLMPEQVDDLTLRGYQHAIYDFIRYIGSANSSDVAAYMGTSQNIAATNLKVICDKGYITRAPRKSGSGNREFLYVVHPSAQLTDHVFFMNMASQTKMHKSFHLCNLHDSAHAAFLRKDGNFAKFKGERYDTIHALRTAIKAHRNEIIRNGVSARPKKAVQED